MDKGKIMVGIDIGTTKICTVVGRMNEHNKLDVLGIGFSPSDGVVKGLISNIDKTVERIIAANKIAEDQADVNISYVNVAISSPQVRSAINPGSIVRGSTENEISVDDVARLNDDQYRMVIPHGNQIIHVLPQEYSVDNEHLVKDPVGMSGMKLEASFHVVMAHITPINHIKKSLKRAGVEMGKMIFSPLAAALSILSDEEKEAGVALVDIGGGTVDVAIFYEGIVRHTCVIPFAGNVITADIKQGLGLMESQAEQVKIKYGSALPEAVDPDAVVVIEGLRNRTPRVVSLPALVSIIHWRMVEILQHVHNEIIFSGYEYKLGGGIVLTGGGAQLPGVKHLCEYVTGIDTKIGYPVEQLGKNESEGAKSPAAAVAVGLVLAGYSSVDERENRYNEARVNPRAEQVKAKGEEKERSATGSFFESFLGKVLGKTRNMLLDDEDMKQGY